MWNPEPVRDTLRVRVLGPLHGGQARRLDHLSAPPDASPSEALKALGIEAISAIPADFPLTWKQAIIRDATASGRPYVSPDLARLLRWLRAACLLSGFRSDDAAHSAL